MFKTNQLDLFCDQTLNPTYEIKRQIRLAIINSNRSRDQIVDEMNTIAKIEGMQSSFSKSALDNWCKDSDPGRLPSPAWMTIFCAVTKDGGPIMAMIKPLGCSVLEEKDTKLLAWARAEMEKRKAMKRARLALEAIE